jgi:hypothetical protein
MEDKERTTDLFEDVGGYPQPPPVPLPTGADVEALVASGVKPGRLSRGVINTARMLSGFNSFRRTASGEIPDLLRRINTRGPVLFSPIISATLAFEDDPRQIDPLTRAATLLFATRSLRDDLVAGRLAPDQYRGQALEMGQYHNFFATSLIVEGKTPRVYKSTNLSRVAVLVDRKFYTLEVGNLGTEVTIEQLREALLSLVHEARSARSHELSPALLTSASQGTQIRAFRQLQKNETNRRSLSALRHSFVTLCLDLESEPTTYAEAAYVAHSANAANRWHHASLQLVVFGNAKACAICNFSAYLDGNVMMRGAAEIQRRAAIYPLPDKTRADFPSLPPAIPLHWQIRQAVVTRARKDFQMVLDNQQATFEIDGIGRRAFDEHGVQAIPTFILALQMTNKRLIGRSVNITQFLTMSKYCCMDLATAVVSTPAVDRFVDYMEKGDGQIARTRELLDEAISSQQRASRLARSHLSDQRMVMLYALSSKMPRRLYATFVHLTAVLLLRLLGLRDPIPREVLVSHPAIHSEIPVVGRPGIRLPYVKYYGLHYQMMDEKTVITMMPSTTWIIANAEWVDELAGNLRRIHSLLMQSDSQRIGG